MTAAGLCEGDNAQCGFVSETFVRVFLYVISVLLRSQCSIHGLVAGCTFQTQNSGNLNNIEEEKVATGCSRVNEKTI